MKTSRWLYRLQQRFSITWHESVVLLILTLLLGLGLIVRTLQDDLQPVPEDIYTDTDRLFRERSRLPAARSRPADAPRKTDSSPRRTDQLIDLNTASPEQLQRLPRIGPVTAGRILAYRRTHGGFRRVDELQRIRGIGPKTLAGLRARVTATPPPDSASYSAD